MKKSNTRIYPPLPAPPSRRGVELFIAELSLAGLLHGARLGQVYPRCPFHFTVRYCARLGCVCPLALGLLKALSRACLTSGTMAKPGAVLLVTTSHFCPLFRSLPVRSTFGFIHSKLWVAAGLPVPSLSFFAWSSRRRRPPGTGLLWRFR